MDSEDIDTQFLHGKTFKDLDKEWQAEYNAFPLSVLKIPKDTDPDTGELKFIRLRVKQTNLGLIEYYS